VSVERWGRIVWDYHRLGHTLREAEVIIALGSHDTRVAERAADVFLEGWASLLVTTGRRGLVAAGYTRRRVEGAP
jgi:hypothetical protein